jgi:hypothetical protein
MQSPCNQPLLRAPPQQNASLCKRGQSEIARVNKIPIYPASIKNESHHQRFYIIIVIAITATATAPTLCKCHARARARWSLLIMHVTHVHGCAVAFESMFFERIY